MRYINMRSAVWTALILMLATFSRVSAQDIEEQTQLTLEEIGRMLRAPLADDPRKPGELLQRIQIRFLDTYVDPDLYIVGPGDNFQISFTSNEIPDINAGINSDGSLFIKSVGTLTMPHVTLAEAKTMISQAVEKNYSKSEYAVNLVGFRVARMTIIGEVDKPGIYYAPGSWRVSEVLELAGGLTAKAAQRSITLSGFGDTLTVDLVRYRSFGRTHDNPLICQGNLITVPARDDETEIITVVGMVNRPGQFEYRDNDRLRDYIAYAGGINGPADEIFVMLSSKNHDSETNIDAGDSEALNSPVRGGDNIKLEWKSDRTTYGYIDIYGEVAFPGRHAIDRDTLALDALVALGGGFTNRANTETVEIYRRSWRDDNQRYRLSRSTIGQEVTASRRKTNSYQMSINPRERQNYGDILLIDRDSVYIPRATGMVSVIGAVATPGLVTYTSGKDVDYYLSQVGGLGYNADQDGIVVINPYTGGQMPAAAVRRVFDGEIIQVPVRERQNK